MSNLKTTTPTADALGSSLHAAEIDYLPTLSKQASLGVKSLLQCSVEERDAEKTEDNPERMATFSTYPSCITQRFPARTDNRQDIST